MSGDGHKGNGADAASRGRSAAPQSVYPLYIIAFSVQLGMGIVSPLLPDLMREFSLSAWQAGMVVTSFGLARLVMDLPLGLLLDRINRTAVLRLPARS